LKRIAASCAWTEEEIFNTLELVLEGLKSLHNNGLVHGDLRAKNIVFCEDKNIKLADQFVFSS
jgi:serine/threonine protein kinase